MKNELFQGKYRIKSARLSGWDYSNPGMYFVTICTKNRLCWFGNVDNGKTILSDIGLLVLHYWQKMPRFHKNILLDKFQIMPNHFHGIIRIIKHHETSSTKKYEGDHRQMSEISPNPGSLPSIIRSFKSSVTRKAHKIDKEFVWQNRFYDSIIRNEQHLENVYQYIINNPRKWEEDPFHCDGGCLRMT